MATDVAEDFNLFDLAHWNDPYPVYRQLREQHPIWWSGREQAWVLLRHTDCLDALRDRRLSSNPKHLLLREDAPRSYPRSAMLGVEPNGLLFLDPPDHTRLRRLVGKAFSPHTVESMRTPIRDHVDRVLADAADRREFEFLHEVAYPIAVWVICELLGVPWEDRRQFAEWSAATTKILDGTGRGVIGAGRLLRYLTRLIDRRRVEPGEDLLSRLVGVEEDGDRLTQKELRNLALLLFVAGHETTMNFLASGTYALLRHRDQWDRLAGDPGLAVPAVEELLRYEGPIHVTTRFAVSEVSIGEIMLRPGDQVIVLIGAADHDPERFADPDGLDIARGDRGHLAFSSGIHVCLGAALARLEGEEVFAALPRRLPGLRLATDDVAHREHRVIRGLASLPCHSR
jgi:cytochrome P450